MNTSNVHDVYRLCLDNKAVVLDVRSCVEFYEKYVDIPKVYHIPISEIDDRWIILPLNRKIFVFSEIGDDVSNIIDFLKLQDFDVTLVDGGIVEWEGQGLPMVFKKMSMQCNHICECACKKM